MAELPGLLGGKGKQRESTSDQDYALLEGLLVASSVSAIALPHNLEALPGECQIAMV